MIVVVAGDQFLRKAEAAFITWSRAIVLFILLEYCKVKSAVAIPYFLCDSFNIVKNIQ